MIKRLLSYFLNKLCIFLIVMPLSIIIFYMFFSFTILTGTDLSIFVILFFCLSLPLGEYSVLTEQGDKSQVLFVLLLLIIVIISYIIVEFLFSLIFKVDIGSKILGYKFVDKVKNQVSISKILLRTTIKYISIAFFLPILLFPLLNKRRLFFHEWVSGVYKCDRRGIIQLDSNNEKYLLNYMDEPK